MNNDKWYQLDIEPRDVLFFPEARPMAASSVGEGARWPVPQVFHNALLSALHGMERQEFEHEHQAGKSDKNKNSTFRFGGLKTIGVFPVLGEKLCVPTPADLQYHGDELTLLKPVEKGRCDLPAPLTMVLKKEGPASKRVPAPWMLADDLLSYFSGDLAELTLVEQDTVFVQEARPGIGIDADSGTVEEGKFYLAEYLRLEKEVSLCGFAQCRQKRYADGTDEDLLAPFFAQRKQVPFVFGGQRGVAFLESVRETHCTRLRENRPAGTRVKWVLLTPAIYTGGWLPSWIDADSGKLKTGDVEKPPREPGESREAWRARFRQSGIDATLIAARIPKPFPYSGWRAHGGREDKDGNAIKGAHPTRLCVPAGAVYYFETNEPEKLVDYLHGKTRSDELAEKGFGFGVCGTWKPEEKTV
ncbi:type III-B CRISPR module-associated Cmr3 family protein [Pontiella sp.]|uniref:type III-B CRISPR module-associated Cmr3 family protein n=1 Tax=Pontiella sp. TaxID=2837462 RepID=UPI00356AFE09